MTKAKTSRAVLVTTKHRGVFFGYVKDEKNLPSEITLTGMRNCIYWSSDIGGFGGLASVGPNSSCKIGKRVGLITLYEITSVSDVKDSAVKKWEAA